MTVAMFKFLLLWISIVGLAMQIFHLQWLTTDVIMPKLYNISIDTSFSYGTVFYLFADIVEIPAIITRSYLYVISLNKKYSSKNLLLLLILNSQWLHIFWITNTFLVNNITESVTEWNYFLSWVAIVIDFLEIPVLIDSVGELINEYVIPRNRRVPSSNQSSR